MLRIESRLEKIFAMDVNYMSLAVWLEDRKCSAAVVGLDLVLGLWRCSLKRLLGVVSSVLCIANYSGYIESCR